MELDRTDLDVLIEAVESWESKDSFGEFMGDVMEALVGPKEDAERAAWMEKRRIEKEDRRRKTEDARRVRKERSILLRAKLIAMRDHIEVETFARR